MKKLSKRILLHSLLLCMMMILFTGHVHAAYIRKSITLKQNKKVTQKEDEKKKKDTFTYYYKLSIPSNGFITLSVQKGKTKGNALDFSLYRSMNDDFPFGSQPYSIQGEKKATVKIPMEKGTIYLKTSVGNKIKWKFTKVVPASNYSAQTAMSLKKGKKVIVCQTPQYSFNRWFKVTLTEKQKLSFWAEEGEQVEVLDAKDFLEYPVEHVGSKGLKYSTQEALEAGTYYLCMNEKDYRYGMDGESYLYRFYYSSFYWK